MCIHARFESYMNHLWNELAINWLKNQHFAFPLKQAMLNKKNFSIATLVLWLLL